MRLIFLIQCWWLFYRNFCNLVLLFGLFNFIFLKLRFYFYFLFCFGSFWSFILNLFLRNLRAIALIQLFFFPIFLIFKVYLFCYLLLWYFFFRLSKKKVRNFFNRWLTSLTKIFHKDIKFNQTLHFFRSLLELFLLLHRLSTRICIAGKIKRYSSKQCFILLFI